jgi:hypothetical protein
MKEIEGLLFIIAIILFAILGVYLSTIAGWWTILIMWSLYMIITKGWYRKE